MESSMTLSVDIVSAEGQIYSGNASFLAVPAEMGEIGILPQHTPLLTRMVPGPIRVHQEDSTEEHVFISGGLLEIQPHQVTVLADTAERSEDVDEEAAEQIKQRAEAAVSQAEDQTTVAKAQSELAEASARLKFIHELRSKRR